MGILKAAVSRHVSVDTLWRPRAAWPTLLVVATFIFVACTNSSAATDTGNGSSDQAPDFGLVLFETENHAAGETIRLSQFRGHPVVVNHWFPSCPPCRAEMPEFEEAFQKHRDDGVVFVGVQNLASDSIADGQEFIDEVGVTYANGPDEDNSILLAYEVIGFPSTYFVDKDQNIVRGWTGQLNAEKLEQFIQELLD